MTNPFSKYAEKLFDGEEVIAEERRQINWPYTYRLTIKAKIYKYKPCRKCGMTHPPKRVWGYLIDQCWVHWNEHIGFKAIGSKEETKKEGMKRLAKILGREL